MDLKIRKIVTYTEEILIEGDKPVKERSIIRAAMIFDDFPMTSFRL